MILYKRDMADEASPLVFILGSTNQPQKKEKKNTSELGQTPVVHAQGNATGLSGSAPSF